MALDPGTRLGPYQILSPLGAGGMGEVYKASDTRLDRTVALKILPPEFSTDPARRARFSREAQTISHLNHPHICVLHDVGEAHLPDAEPSSPSAQYLVMEYLEGQTLAARLTKGPLPLAEALRIGADIADALAAAHRQGVVHRDLKPQNVMLARGSGMSGPPTVKLLDFGLAKAREEAAADETSAGPTRTEWLTREGTLVGTLPYMAPEQVEGKPADARTDIWGLGCVLYEMVTGARAFAGDSQASLITSIMSAEPAPLSEAGSLAPPALGRLVRRCLAKSPDDRWDGAHDVAEELLWIKELMASPLQGRPSRRAVWATVTLRALAIVGAALVGALVGTRVGLPGLARPPSSTSPPVRHLAVILPSEAPLWTTPDVHPTLALSPDGSSFAYTCASRGGTQICLRRLDRDQVMPLAGTQGARYPAFSPDGRWIAFCVADGGTRCLAGASIKKVSVADGRVEVLGTTPPALTLLYPLNWDSDGTLFLSGDAGIWAMPASGGNAALVLGLDSTRSDLLYNYPSSLSGGRTIIFSAFSAKVGYEVRALTVATGEQRVLARDALAARYLPTGHLLYVEAGQAPHVPRIIVSPLDVTTLALGPPAPVLEEAGRLEPILVPPLGISASGTVLHLPAEYDRTLTWVDRQRRTVPALGKKGPWSGPQLSPDGRHVALDLTGPTRMGIAVVDLDREVVTDVSSRGFCPTWTPDGQRIVLASWGTDQLLLIASDGAGQPELLHQAPVGTTCLNNGSWSPDGRVLVYSQGQGPDGIVTLAKTGATWSAARFFPVAPEVSVAAPRFSPDGRWIAYASDESQRRFEVWVRAYPGGGERRQVSTEGGYDAVWSPDGGELFYRNGDRFYAVPVNLSPTFSAGAPQLLFSGPYLDSGVFFHSYDVSGDGQRFLVVQISEEERAPRRLHLIENWFEELKAKVPTER